MVSNTGRRRVLITNADLPLGALIAECLLRDEHKHKIEDLVCHVRNFERAGDLIVWGATVIRENHLEQWLEHCDSLILIPNCVESGFERQAERIVHMAKEKQIENIVLMSVLGVDEQSNEYLKAWKHIEDVVKQANEIENRSVVRHGISQQCLYFFMKEVKYEQKLKLPWKEDQKCAPVNLCDLARFVAHLITEGDQGAGRNSSSGGKQLYRLTGPELVSPRTLVEKLNRSAGSGARVQFEQTDMKRMENYLRDIGFNEMMLLDARTAFDLLNAGKLNFTSDDQKKTIGKEPQSLDNFFRENKDRFISSQQSRH